MAASVTVSDSITTLPLKLTARSMVDISPGSFGSLSGAWGCTAPASYRRSTAV